MTVFKSKMVKLELMLLAVCITTIHCDYQKEKEAIVKKNIEKHVGSTLKLTKTEECANEILMKLKNEELAKIATDEDHFPPAMHFFKGKHLIEQSKVFKIIKSLPKGSLLYFRDVIGPVPLHHYMDVSYWPNLYGCSSNGNFKFHFFNGTTNDECDWTLLSELRKKQPNFDDFLKTQISLEVDDPETAYPTIRSVWEKRKSVLEARKNLLSYRPVLEASIQIALDTHYKNNIRHKEVHCTFLPLYESDGKKYDVFEIANIYINQYKKFVLKHPDFSGVMIYHPIDIIDDKSMDKHVEIFKILKEKYGTLVAGFELSGIAESGKLINDFMPQIQLLKENGAQFFFHGPESNWYEKNVQSNVIDSILINATRVAYVDTLAKNPAIADVLQAKEITVEVNPIENQVMKTVPNLRNHPAAVAFAKGGNVVITPGDSGLWHVTDISYDWYMAFMAIADVRADLKFLKQLAINSILGSSVDDETKSKHLKSWSSDWEKVVDGICSDGKMN